MFRIVVFGCVGLSRLVFFSLHVGLNLCRDLCVLAYFGLIFFNALVIFFSFLFLSLIFCFWIIYPGIFYNRLKQPK